jgi:uncharacterized protein DUF4166
MRRRRAGRLSTAAPVGPPEPSLHSFDTCNLLSDLRFRRLVGDDDWASLSPAIRRRFTQRLAGGNTIVYSGEVVATRLSRAGWWLAQVARLFGGPLPISTDTRVPSVVTVTEDMAKGGQVWTRLYARRNGFPQIIHSAKRFAGKTGLEEHVGHGLGVALTVHVQAGALVFRSDHYFLQVFGLRLRLPDALTPGLLSVAHTEISEGEFSYTLEVAHPRLGTLIHQCATFRETEQWTPRSSASSPPRVM